MSTLKKINPVRNSCPGFAALVVVVIVGAAALIIALSTALLGMRELEIATTFDRGWLAKTFADGCLDTALLALRLNPMPGNSDFTSGLGRCIITMSDEGGGNRRVTVHGIVGENDQLLEALVATAPSNHSITLLNYNP
ncbi:MAG TPA: hypothetical protein VJB69_02745 [Candidatus Paceibacterota bacterium]